jgi:hypothetical protein
MDLQMLLKFSSDVSRLKKRTPLDLVSYIGMPTRNHRSSTKGHLPNKIEPKKLWSLGKFTIPGNSALLGRFRISNFQVGFLWDSDLEFWSLWSLESGPDDRVSRSVPVSRIGKAGVPGPRPLFLN